MRKASNRRRHCVRGVRYFLVLTQGSTNVGPGTQEARAKFFSVPARRYELLENRLAFH